MTDPVCLSIYRLEDGESTVPAVQELLNAYRPDEPYSIGAIYTVVYRLIKQGDITTVVLPKRQIRGGRARKVFRLTAKGLELLIAAEKMRASILNGKPLLTDEEPTG